MPEAVYPSYYKASNKMIPEKYKHKSYWEHKTKIKYSMLESKYKKPEIDLYEKIQPLV